MLYQQQLKPIEQIDVIIQAKIRFICPIYSEKVTIQPPLPGSEWDFGDGLTLRPSALTLSSPQPPSTPQAEEKGDELVETRLSRHPRALCIPKSAQNLV